MRDFVNGDKVEVLSPREEKGAQGIVTEVTSKGCTVRITSSGPSFKMTKKIGEEIGYLKRNLRRI